MVGVQRTTVSAEAARLQQAGVIQYARGVLTVTDRRALEAAACECLGIIRREYERLLGPAAPPSK
jgi:Mn-dependent DtxR family transcriptional regulator